jgi:hypothetical protein
MNLEQQYRAAQEADEAVVSRIRQACSAFMRRHPEFLPTKANEQILFAAMSAPENDHLVPTSVASWEDVYAQRREQLEQRPATRRHVAPTSRLTRAEVDSWSATRMQKEIESSPRREKEIEAALSRR